MGDSSGSGSLGRIAPGCNENGNGRESISLLNLMVQVKNRAEK